MSEANDMQGKAASHLSTYPIGTKIVKYFRGHGWFEGKIIAADNEYYRVWYEDGDTEEMDDNDIAQWLEIEEDNEDYHDDEDYHDRNTRKRRKTKKNGPNDNKRVHGIRDTLLWTIQGLDPKNFACELDGYDQDSKLRAANFFLFVFERQSLWKRRQEGQSAPWTKLNVFQQFNFCNVYRELDRGTAFLHAYIVKLWQELRQSNEENHISEREWTTHVLWAVFCYRAVNRVATFETTGFPKLDSSTVESFLQKCHTVREERGVFFTGVHQTANMNDFMDRLKKVSCNDFRVIRKAVDQLLEARTLKECVQCLQQLPGIGEFMSWQVACDLRESRCLSTVNEYGYCALGPGAKHGLQHIFSKAENGNFLELAQSLEDNQQTFYDALGLEFPTWNGIGLGLKEIEHSLCEYAKFQALCKGKRVKCARRPATDTADKGLPFSCNACMGYQSGKESATGKSTTPFWLCGPCRAFESVSF